MPPADVNGFNSVQEGDSANVVCGRLLEIARASQDYQWQLGIGSAKGAHQRLLQAPCPVAMACVTQHLTPALASACPKSSRDGHGQSYMHGKSASQWITPRISACLKHQVSALLSQDFLLQARGTQVQGQSWVSTP